MFRFLLLIATTIFTQLNAKDYHSDSLAVRAILDANRLQKTSVDSVIKADSVYIYTIDSIENREIFYKIDLRITELHLDNLEIDTLPDQIGDLGDLRLLSARNNNIRVLNKALANLIWLRSIFVSNNALIEFPTVNQYCRIDADSNKISYLPDSMPTASISLKNNLITQIPLKWLGRSWGDLDLSNNLISSVPPKIWQTRARTANWTYACVPDPQINLSGNLLKTLPDVPDDYDGIRFDFSNNTLISLPASIVKLKHDICVPGTTPMSSAGYCQCNSDYSNFINFSDNKLCNLPSSIESWLDTSAGNWRTSQTCESAAMPQPRQEEKAKFRCVSTNTSFSVYSLGHYKNLFGEVFDFRGQLILSRKIAGNSFTLSNLKPGIYIVLIKDKKILLKKAFSIVR